MNFEVYKQSIILQLSELYEEREASTIFRFCCEDVLNLTVSDLIGKQQFTSSELEQLNKVFIKILNGEPYQYAVGFTYFDDLKINVDSSVLIPRPETEELVAWCSEFIANENVVNVLDWCTGSGCIALSLKNRHPETNVFAFDWYEKTLHKAIENSITLKLPVQFEKKDALQKHALNLKFDLIVSNPPYIPEEERKEMSNHVLKFEPGQALFVSNEDPLLFYRSIAEFAQLHLTQNGSLFFEIHENLGNETKDALNSFGFEEIEIKKDLQGKNRMIKARFKR